MTPPRSALSLTYALVCCGQTGINEPLWRWSSFLGFNARSYALVHRRYFPLSFGERTVALSLSRADEKEKDKLKLSLSLLI